VPAKYRPSTFPLYGDYTITVCHELPGVELPAHLVYKLNETNLAEIAYHPALPKFMSNYIPLAEEEPCAGCPGCRDENKPAAGSPLYFDCLANRARGRKLLGYLKADVDNLGSLFVYGLKDDQNERNSISRIATMSRMLDLFFSGRVDQLLNIRFNHCYTIFSGGDDLLIAGPWDEIVDLATFIQDEFKKFTNNNENVTLSAGISLLKPAVPVSRSVQAADESLEASKETVLKGETEGRNQLSLLGRTMKWPKAAPLLDNAKQLSDWLNNDKLSVGFLRKLLIFSEMHRQYFYFGRVRGLRYLPLLNYAIARNIPKPDNNDRVALALRLWLENLKKPEHEHTIHLDFLVKYALLGKE